VFGRIVLLVTRRSEVQGLPPPLRSLHKYAVQYSAAVLWVIGAAKLPRFIRVLSIRAPMRPGAHFCG
jgi:hypothetical protein